MNATRRTPTKVIGEIPCPTMRQEIDQIFYHSIRNHLYDRFRERGWRDAKARACRDYAMALRRESERPRTAELIHPDRRERIFANRGRPFGGRSMRFEFERAIIEAGHLERRGRRGIQWLEVRKLGLYSPETRTNEPTKSESQPALKVLIRDFPDRVLSIKNLETSPDAPPAPAEGPADEADEVGFGLIEKENENQAAEWPLSEAAQCSDESLLTDAPESDEEPVLEADETAPLGLKGDVQPWLLAAAARIQAQLDRERADRVARGEPAEIQHVEHARPSEAECRGFRREEAESRERPRSHQGAPQPPPKPRRDCRLPDDRQVADVCWIQFELRKVPCLSRVHIPAMFARKYTRGTWRAAVAAALSEAPGRLRESPEAFILGVAKRLHEGDATDVRRSPHFFPLDTWPPAMRAFANVKS